MFGSSRSYASSHSISAEASGGASASRAPLSSGNFVDEATSSREAPQVLAEYGHVLQLPGEPGRLFWTREVLGRLLALGEYQLSAAHSDEVYLSVVEGDVGPFFRSDLHARVEDELP